MTAIAEILEQELARRRPACPGCGHPLEAREPGRCDDCGEWLWTHMPISNTCWPGDTCPGPRCRQGHIVREMS